MINTSSLPNIHSIALRVKVNSRGRAFIVPKRTALVSILMYGFAVATTALTGYMYVQSLHEQPTSVTTGLRQYQNEVELREKTYRKIADEKREREKVEAEAAAKEKEQTTIVSYYVQRNKSISRTAIRQIVRHASEASAKYNVPQTLILAVIETESGLNPFAKSSAEAEGLMQVIPSYHQDKIKANGGIENIVNPKYNILIGTAVLKEYLVKYNFNTELALLQYNGSLDDASKKYANKVLLRKTQVDHYVHSAVKA